MKLVICGLSYSHTERLNMMEIIAIWCICLTFVNIATALQITWRNAPLNQVALVGKDYHVQCDVTADPAPSIEWLRNGDSIKDNDKYVIRNTGMVIKNVEESDDGIYICRASVIFPDETGELAERHILVAVSK